MTGRAPRAAVALVVLLALTGCGEEPEGVKVMNVERGDGTHVECAVYNGYRQGGITCDWDGAQ